ncbi:glycoside hydrolase domain-containing protein [Edaphobacter aggregans]|uniref:glycoside hydrolase domain-containing protein n=1 Tax=Edaphobacter aggregans TaxID=570835 RepID=UPI0005508C13|nr:glycoside hydrolase domain-containing protein [Edaphobacter aggregans]
MGRILSTSAAALLLANLAFAPAYPAASQTAAQPSPQHLGFDRNLYPGDSALPALRQHFAFTGYWLNNPPGETTNTWRGKREVLLRNGFGFLVLFNGRLDAEILRAKRRNLTPEKLGQQDAAAAIAAAQREHFPAGTILFLDQEEGGRLLPEQSAYLFAFTETLAASAYLPGVYLSGQPVEDSPGKTITTAQHVREQVTAKHLHPIALFVYQDACPPSSGCSLTPPPLTTAGTPDIAAWQYAQSPRRPENTATCRKTYAADNNCYAPGVPGIYLDMSVATSDDPSHGR